MTPPGQVLGRPQAVPRTRGGASAEPAPPGDGRRRRWRRALPLLLPLLLCAAAINPYFLPGQYDDIVYYYGARSLAEHGTYQFEGKYIVDWPPVFSLVLAGPMLLGVGSVAATKAIVLVFVGAGLFLVRRLLEREGRADPLAVTVIFGLLPTAFLMGSRIMTEWPFITGSFLFLILLDRLNTAPRRLRAAALAGVVLGVAALTRYAGVLLGAAVVAQACIRLRSRGDRPALGAILPEAVVALIGGGMWTLWKAKLAWQMRQGTADPGNWGNFGFASAKSINPLEYSPLDVVAVLGGLLFKRSSVAAVLGPGSPVPLLIDAFVLAVLAATVAYVVRRRLRPTDWYVLTTLVLFSISIFKYDRHWLPIAPFLIAYALDGLKALAGWVGSAGGVQRTLGVTVALWTCLLAGMDGYALLYGDGNQRHGGLCPWVSRSPEAFYKGDWLDLYLACRRIRQDPAEGAVAVAGISGKYVQAFSHRRVVFAGAAQEARFVLVPRLAGGRPDLRAFGGRVPEGLVEVAPFRTVALYRTGG